MPNTLSVKQFAILALGQSSPPWHLSALLSRYNQKFLALKNTIENLSTTNAVIYVAMQTAANVAAMVATMGPTDDELDWASRWTDVSGLFANPNDHSPFGEAYVPVKKSDLETLQSILTSAGAFIFYLSPYIILKPEQLPLDPYAASGEAFIPPWVTIGIGGTFAALASIKGKIFPFDPANWSAEDWTELKGLTQGVVITSPGALWSAGPLINVTHAGVTSSVADVEAGADVGPTPSTMVVLTEGN